MRFSARLSAALAAVIAAMTGLLAWSVSSDARNALAREAQARTMGRAVSAARLAGLDPSPTESELLPLLYGAVAGETGGFALALDRDGFVLAHTDVTRARRPSSEAWQAEAASSGEPFLRVLGQGEERAVVACVPLGRPGEREAEEVAFGGALSAAERRGTLCLGSPLASADAAAGAIARRLALLVAAGGAAIVVVVLAAAGALLAPLRRLHEALSRIGTGAPDVILPAGPRDEIGEIASAFNAMVARLRESTVSVTQLHAMLDAMDTAVFVMEPSGRISWLNRAARGLVEAEEGAELTARELFPDGLPPPGLSVPEARLAGRGGPRAVMLGTAPLGAETDAAPGLVITARDLSERKKLEEELAQSQKMEALGRLAGGIAHDFNNMLTVVIGIARDLRDELAGHPAAGELEHLLYSAERAAALTRQLLTFSRSRAEPGAACDVNSVVAAMEGMLRRVLGTDIALSVVPAAARPAAALDATRLEQVLLNLAVNARDAMPKGGTLVISTRDAAGGGVELVVEDTGCGMTPEVAARAFEPFFTTKPTGQGTGLGLAVVHGIVREAGGGVTLDTAPGKGARFTIRLPGAAQGAAPAAPPVVPFTGAAAAEVLLVEDEAAVRRLCRRALEKAGYSVREAADGVEALEVLERLERLPEALVSDLVMPRLNGIELAHRLRARSPGARILLLSGTFSEAVARYGAPPPGTRALEKPFTTERLVREVRSLLAGTPPKG